MKRKTFSFVSCAVLMFSAGINASADEPQNTALSAQKNAIYIKEDNSVHTVCRTPDANTISDPFLEESSVRYGYEFLGKLPNGKARQKLYDALYNISVQLWSGDQDLKNFNLVDGDHCLAAALDIKDFDLTSTQAIETYFTFRNDNPAFYFASTNFAYSDKSLFYLTSTDYKYAFVRNNIRKTVKSYFNNIKNNAPKNASAYDTAKYVHDVINKGMEYVHQNTAYEHNIVGTCIYGKGVCESYARTYQLALNLLGVNNLFISGKSNNVDHAWNMIQLDDGRYYFTDCTWDDMLGNYNYFAKSLPTFSADHIYDTPENTGVYFLYSLPKAAEKDFDPDYIPIAADANSDGFINIKDVIRIQNYINDPYTDLDIRSADINSDGEINIRDVIRIQKILNGNNTQ